MATTIGIMVLVANGLILVHELGHLVAAKWAGMPVASFSLGFGPALISFRIGPTRYRLALIPLGGFVRIHGMKGTPAERRAWPDGFAFQPLVRRMIVVIAGVAANALFAALLYAALALTGGARVPTPPRVAAVFEEDLPPEAAGWTALPRETNVVSFGGREVAEWEDLALALLGSESGREVIRFADGSTREVVVPGTEQARAELLRALLPELPPVLGRIERGSPAERAGLRTGDRIVAVDGAPVRSFADWLEVAASEPHAPVTLRILREGRGIDLRIEPRRDGPAPDGSFGWLGAQLGSEGDAVADVGSAVAYGAREVERNTRMIAESGRLLATGAVGLRSVAGPVEIARMSERAYRMNWHQFLAFVAFLSLNLAILNFLPIPVLDGGHFLFLAVEGAAGRRLPRFVYRYGNLAGATVILFFMAFALLNDLLKVLGL